MAMLAEPRRKQRLINLRAKNSEWSNDSNKFGQKMLEKMGWSAGKGLGANENGIVEHVIAKYKNDDKGLGFEDKNDQWTKHEDDFNALLANLSSGDKTEDKLLSGVSLEVKSKKSKARVHYHKFTRGKDLSRYSEKDLANIFGKKSLKEKKSEPEILKDDIKTTEQVFTEKGSMIDYFKSKLAAFKNKVNLPSQEASDDDKDYSFQGFSNANENENIEENNTENQGFQGFLCYNTQPDNDENKELDSTDKLSENTEKKKKRKKKKEISAQETNEETNLESEIHEINQDIEIEESKKKRKKSKKNKNKGDNEMECAPASDILIEEPVLKKSKKSKKKYEEINTEVPVEHNVIEEDHVPKKKKKRKNNVPE